MEKIGKYPTLDGLHRTSIKARADAGLVSFGMVINVPDPAMVEIAALAGCQFVRIDMEHNLFGVERLQHLIRTADACGIATYARLDQYDLITPLLDFGIEGFMFPHVRSAAQARELVDRVKYAPAGRRGFANGGRAQRYGRMPFPEYVDEAQGDIFLQVQIEDREGLDNMEEIIATPGLDYICTGRGDIAQAIGLLGRGDDERVSAVENQIMACAKKHGLRCQISVGNEQQARYYYGYGVRTFTIGDDRKILLDALQARLDTFRAIDFDA